MTHNPNCAVVRSGDLRAWCDCGEVRPPWYGGNKIPDSYLKRFRPAGEHHDDLPFDLRVFIDNLATSKPDAQGPDNE